MDLRDALQQSLGAQYTVERELGGGGMSRVFLALDRTLGRRIVAKVLAPELAAGVNRERFEQEVQLSAQLQHPNIVTVLGTGVLGELPYYTMPFVAGESLRAALEQRGTIPPREAVPILRDAARALAFAHARGVVHRDIKPDNVLLSGGAAMVTDFGVAKALSAGHERPVTPTASGGAPLTALGTSLGTLGYMAPEQAAADPSTDHRADLYSFGAMAYEMLAGRAPFAGLPPRELLTAIVAREPEALASLVPGVPPALAALVHRCLAKDPAQRPATADEVVAALDTALTGSGPVAVAMPAPRWRLPAIVGVAGLGLALAWWMLGRRDAPAGGVPPNSLAVLPLTLSGGDSADAYFADGITEELTIALSRVPSLRVASSTSAFAMRGRGADVREVARQLGVANVLAGSVRRGGDRVRVAVQLTSASDGLVRWAESYEREVTDVFEVQEEVGRAIASALEVAFEPAAPVATRATGDMAAYDLFLKGRFHWRQRGEASLRLAAGYFEQAIARDSTFARAWAGLADALGLLPIYGPTPVDSVLPIVERAAGRALALDSTLADAHAARGQLYKTLGRWSDAETALRRAIAADSTYASAHQWLGELYASVGRPADAVAAMQAAARIDPMSPIITGELGYLLALAGQHDSAAAVGRRAIALAPGLWTGYAFLGSTHLWAGEPAQAVQPLGEAMRLAPQNPFGGVHVAAVAGAGDRPRAQQLLRELEAAGRAGKASPTSVAIGLVSLGERAAALDWLERAHAARDGMLYSAPLNVSWFAPIWDEPRFRALRAAMNLAALPAPSR
jgi:TolB-like protein/tRNA A-37 threonylcarbamoyl transferase component Bud32/Tfp pilus assembly protein PilF